MFSINNCFSNIIFDPAYTKPELEILQISVHFLLHVVAPLVIARLFFRENFLRTYIIIMLTMLVDLDHLVADPVFMTCRCSIGFHILHQHAVIPIYIIMTFFKPTRLAGIGLSLHMLTDYIDCMFMEVVC